MNEELKITLIGTLNDNFQSELIDIQEPYNFLTIQVKPEKIVDIISHLYHHTTLQFQFLTDLTAVHFPDANQLELVYHLHSLVNNIRVRFKTRIPVSHPEISTLSGVFSGANWMERETYDNFGVIFKGHPNLKRILNVEDMLIFPLRKEYPLEDQTRHDKNDTMFGR